MYKNQLQELAQRSCFNLPSYTCVREGPDHAPRFKAIVDFNGETFESPNHCSTLRQAEHTAAEAALISLSSRGPSHALAARVLDETGVYKNLLQEIAQRVGSPLPRYTTFRSGLGHYPVFTGTVTLSGIVFKGEPAKNKKQAEKNAALAAWLALKELARTQNASNSSSLNENKDEQEQIRIARALQSYLLKEKTSDNNPITINQNSTFVSKAPFQNTYSSYPSPRRPVSPQRPLTSSSSKILPFFNTDKPSPRDIMTTSDRRNRDVNSSSRPHLQFPRFPAYAGPVRQCGPGPSSYGGFGPPPVNVRTIVPVFSAPPVNIRRVVNDFSPGQKERSLSSSSSSSSSFTSSGATMMLEPKGNKISIDDECDDVDESTAIRCLEQLDI